ncbi:MAG: bi-domain-containing oxidoreductase [Candidatus Dependentiae bacterium]|nr:bi-domain-containing oxidoreductase [Candidatus Dependentiae bacterium]
MKHIFLDKEAAVMKEVAQPFLDDHTILVSVYYSFISSDTEIEALINTKDGLFSNVPYKIKKVLQLVSHNIDHDRITSTAREHNKIKSAAIGYSCAGRVVAIGKKVQRLSVGDLIACAGEGYAHYADLLCVPEHVAVRVHSQEHLRAASITTIGAIALQGIRRARLSLGEQVCVFGLGLIGQLMVQLAKIAGCAVVAIDTVPERLLLAKKLGADATYQLGQDDIIKEINMFTEHYGVDVALVTDALEGNALIKHAMEITRINGRVVIVGSMGLEEEQSFYCKKGVELLFSSFCGSGRYDYPYVDVRWTENKNMQAFVQLIEQGKIDIHSLLPTEVLVNAIGDTYKSVNDNNLLGVVLRYAHETKEASLVSYKSHAKIALHSPIHFTPAIRDTISLGLIGAGDTAKKKLLPIVSKIKNARIDVIVDTDIANALAVSRMYGAAKTYSHDNQLFLHTDLDAVIIASPHIFHCDQALNALQQGKAVFLERPMATSNEQLSRLRTFLVSYPQAPFCVNYNRSSAPFIKKIKTIVEKRCTPLTIMYRMNVGLIPREKWIHTEVGAGRIIGDACHIFDVFCFLTGANPVSVSVQTMHASRDDIFPTDNFSAHIRFDDGSICVLIYSSLGHADLGRERMEVFVDGKTMVLDDYIRLFGFGVPSWFNETVLERDKGHDFLIRTFFDSLKQPLFVPPIAFNRLCMVAELSLLVDQLACEDGGSRRL